MRLLVGLILAVTFALPVRAETQAHVFVITQENGKTRVLDLFPNGKDRAVLLEEPGDEIEGIVIGQDGRHIAMRRKSEAQIIIFDTATKQSTKLLGTGGAQPRGFLKSKPAF